MGEARNGKEGLEMILNVSPDLVITDVKMPVMDGLEMLGELYEKDVHVHSIILSGYSEFEYAQKAIGFGVDDYLLKPLAPEDILGALEKIQGKLAEELKNKSSNSQRILWRWLQGAAQDEELEAERAELLTDPGKAYVLLAGYGWDTLFEERKKMLEAVRGSRVKRRFPDMHCALFEETRELVCLLPLEAFAAFTEEMAWSIERGGEKWVWAQSPVEDWLRLDKTMEKLRTLYLYGERYPGRIVSGKETQAFAEEPFSYPEELERRIRTAVYKEDGESAERYLQEFHAYLEKKEYAPPQIREAYLRLTHRLMGFLEDVERSVYEKLEPMQYTDKMNRACTRREMRRILDGILHAMQGAAAQKEDISNYAIKKAISYIRMHYAENISLEEIADMLDLTPEYLSALFNREVGVNFTAFLRDFRLSHAKRLLKGTDKKVYEIAQEVGYSDSKYFNRVFKENVGVSPREFRQM